MATSASVTIVPVADEELFPGTGSGVVPDTVAVLVSCPVRSLSTVRVRVICGAAWPASRSAARVHVTVLTAAPSAGQVQPVPEADTNVVPAGTSSVTVIGPREVEGPRLETLSV